MKYINEFRNKKIVADLSAQIVKLSKSKITLMEVCGGHTMAIQKFGIPSLLPDTINLISGPGCPVCVSSRNYIDNSIQLARFPENIITTYGDLIRVPGSQSSLDIEKASGADVRIVYSTLDALEIARKNPGKNIIFLGIGFETTTPSSAVAIQQAAKEKITNFFVYSTHKIMPPAMEALIDEGIQIDGYIGPGHVSTVAGSQMYRNLVNRFRISVVISGFEPVDILQSIYMLVKQHETRDKKIEIQYTRTVLPEGNLKARKLVDEVFEPRNDWWRGLGIISDSGLKIREKYVLFDAEKKFNLEDKEIKEPGGCICGEVLKGLKKPVECGLFKKVCTPENPVGACMVSNEGACNAYFRFSGYEG
ncbi:MAG: hydrogenase formation protein HypD [Bacteroidales bacterium]|nr:hydrogenase formation protein HypD [Bacteroidales bacterium]